MDRSIIDTFTKISLGRTQDGDDTTTYTHTSEQNDVYIDVCFEDLSTEQMLSIYGRGCENSTTHDTSVADEHGAMPKLISYRDVVEDERKTEQLKENWDLTAGELTLVGDLFDDTTVEPKEPDEQLGIPEIEKVCIHDAEKTAVDDKTDLLKDTRYNSEAKKSSLNDSTNNLSYLLEKSNHLKINDREENRITDNNDFTNLAGVNSSYQNFKGNNKVSENEKPKDKVCKGTRKDNLIEDDRKLSINDSEDVDTDCSTSSKDEVPDNGNDEVGRIGVSAEAVWEKIVLNDIDDNYSKSSADRTETFAVKSASSRENYEEDVSNQIREVINCLQRLEDSLKLSNGDINESDTSAIMDKQFSHWYDDISDNDKNKYKNTESLINSEKELIEGTQENKHLDNTLKLDNSDIIKQEKDQKHNIQNDIFFNEDETIRSGIIDMISQISVSFPCLEQFHKDKTDEEIVEEHEQDCSNCTDTDGEDTDLNSIFEKVSVSDNYTYVLDHLSESFNNSSSSSDTNDVDDEPEYFLLKSSEKLDENGFKITLRVKERKTYADAELDDDDIEGKRTYKIEDKIVPENYAKQYVRSLKGEEFNLRYLQENGLQMPIIFHEKSGLGLRVPSDNFKVSDVKACVGSRRMLDVMDVTTQKGMEMTMKEWTRYYENPERDRLLNVISLEFSHTRLENYVESPNLVREVDWVDTAWPQHLKDCQTESTNAIDKMKYPKVQKYCLMSVMGCYTDFHIDFGGTSVWYHILHGEKIFWLIPPTEKNLLQYENWVLSGKQGENFLADKTPDCQMIRLKAGCTFIIPSGWIHAVYTPKDSLVFGGNFLHNFNMFNQVRVSSIEDKTHVPMKFRYPFYTEINWYVLERYVHSLTGVTYLEKPQLNEDLEVINTKEASGVDFEDKLSKRVSVALTRIDDSSPRRKSSSDDDSNASRSPIQAAEVRSSRKSSSESTNSADLRVGEKTDSKLKVPYRSPVKKKTKYVHLTKYELEGLTEVVAWLESLPPTKKGIPRDLIDPEMVMAEIKRLIREHMADNPELAITGEPVLEWTKATKKLIKLKQKAKTAKLLGAMSAPKVKGPGKNSAAGKPKHRRVRCKKCEPCTRDDCMECNFCKDMKKYGGPGKAKQSCISRQCLAPMLPNNVSCDICKLDKPLKSPGGSEDTGDDEFYQTSLMECGLCWEIVHPVCLGKKYENLTSDGVINEDLPNSWKCSRCCFDGKEGQLKTRVFKGGWRPNPTGTPPPYSPQSPDSIITEGKRVTANQAMDTKPSLGPGSPLSQRMSPLFTEEFQSSFMKKEKKMELHSPTTVKSEYVTSPDTKVENFDPDERSLSPKPSKVEKPDTKRKIAAESESPLKKRRLLSRSPLKSSNKPSSTSAKSSRGSGSPGRSRGHLQVTKGQGRTPDMVSKRSRREDVLGNGSGHSTLYDFDDSELMDVSTPLSDRGRGRGGLRGRKITMGAGHDSQSKINPHSSNVSTKLNFGNGEGLEDRGNIFKKFSEKPPNADQLKKSLLEHIEKKNLRVIAPKFVIRPGPAPPPEDYVLMASGKKHPLPRLLWTKVFGYLSPGDLARCLAVCQVWNRWCINPELWREIDLSRKRIVKAHLMGVVRRQPEVLNLTAVTMTQKQILWLLERLPLLKTLHLSRCSWATISGLCMSSCPLLHRLDVSWASGLKEECFEDLITPPVDRRPAMKNVSRLHRLRYLNLAGTEINDKSLNLLTMHLARLENLNISYCTHMTDRGIKAITSSKSATQETLKNLDISGCRQLTDTSLHLIRKLKNLKELNIANCTQISPERCRDYSLPNVVVYK